MPAQVRPNQFTETVDGLRIEFQTGSAALVDLLDVDLVKAYRWHVGARGHVATHYPRDTTVYLGRHLLGATARQVVVHLNGDKLDCRRVNLQIKQRLLRRKQKGRKV